MKNFYTTSLKNVMILAIGLIAFLSHSNLDAQLVVVASSNASSFCNTSCDTLQLSGQVFYNGNPEDASSVSWSWTGPNGFTSSIPNPRVPITTLNQEGEYCVTIQTIGLGSAADCVDIDVIETINWTCPQRITVTGVDCTTDLVDYNFTVSGINCGVSSDFELVLYNGSTNAIIYQQTWTGAAGTYYFGPAADPMDYPSATSVIENLPFGTHQLVNTIYNDSDPSKVYAQCITDVRVIESINNVACNDFINLTLTNDCEALITPDMILQGNYCYENFVMSIENVATNENEVLLTAPGEYVVTVTGLSGISCWGRILAEDKSRPILDCQDIEVYCSEFSTLGQGAIIHGFDKAEISGFSVDPNDSEDFVLAISGVTGRATNIVLTFDAQMPDVSDLELYLTPPSGLNTIELINSSAYSDPCTESNIHVCMFDEAPLDNSNFASPEYCRSTLNAWIGEIKPRQAFSNLYSVASGPALGNWELTVVNKNLSSSIQINRVELRVQTNEGNIMSSADVIINSGCSVPEFDAPKDKTIGVDCGDGYWNVIERTWTVRNPISGLSSTCSHTISLLKWDLDDIIWPKNWNNIELPTIYCRDLFRPNGNLDFSKVSSDTIPLPAYTGSPRVPFGELCGNFQVTYTDLKFRVCGKYASKIIRRWAVLDWCDNIIGEHDQIIKIDDNEPIDLVREDYADVNPSGYANADAYIIFTDYFDCSGDWPVVPPIILDPGCDPEYSLQVFYLVDDDEDPSQPPVNGSYIDDNVVYDNSGFPIRINNLPSGRRTWIRYNVTDDCGNTGVAFAEVDVIDNDKPSPVCIEYTVVALNNEGCAKLHAESLDNGSWDNCGIESFLIRRSNSNAPYAEYIKYCCDNCNQENDFVNLLVTDINGNTNTCKVEVEIQDNIDAILTEEPQYVYNFDCTDQVNVGAIIDNALNSFAYEDNCDPNGNGTFDIIVNFTRSDGKSKNDPITQQDCGEGVLTIFYELLDECGRPLPNGQNSRNQSIFIKNNATNYFVNWPLDPPPYNTCNTVLGLHPDNLPPQFVVDFDDVSTSQCTNLAITWDDLVFENVDNACLKILRTWTVIDWCIADRLGITAATRTHVQTIKVNDTQGPEFDAPSNVTWDATTDQCRVNVTDTLLIIDVTDACTDMFINQKIDVQYRIFYADGTVSNLVIGSLNATGLYPYGTSRIEWVAEDHCGNISNWTTFVTVRDVKAPTPYCLGTVVTATMVENQPVSIWAIDFDLGGFDNVTGNTNCNNNKKLQIYFRDTINGVPTKVQGLSFDCDDVPNGISELIELKVYYEDEAGNVDFCIVQLFLQDNVNDVCEDDVTGSRIAGSIHTEETESLANVKVELKSNVNDFNSTTLTNFNGDYAFEGLPMNNSYYVSAEKNDNPLNGVSTLDLVIIQKHILGIATLDSPFKLMAADADNTGNVSATDLITIRKLILGILNEFPNNQKSWRFPEMNQNFVDVNKPFPYNETITMFSLNSSSVNNKDFMAIKVGDVNGTAIANSINGPTDENNRMITFEINEAVFSKGNLVEVPFYATDIESLIGFQNTMNFDSDVLEFESIESGALNMNEDNVGMYDLDSGILTLSWSDSESKDIDADKALFTLKFRAKTNAVLSDHVYLSSHITKAEAYTADLEIMNMRLNVKGVDDTEFVLYQNTPNPFSEYTDIRFNLPEESNIVFSVFDLNGREILSETKSYAKGMHTISLNRDQIESSGVMYYTLETAFGVETRKMIQIK